MKAIEKADVPACHNSDHKFLPRWKFTVILTVLEYLLCLLS